MNESAQVHDDVASATNEANMPEVKPDIWRAVEIKKSSKGRTPRQNLNKNRLTAGLCSWCGKPHDRATYRCRDCTAKVVSSNAATRKKRREDGLCIICETPWEGRHLVCATCRAFANARLAEKSKLNPDKCERCNLPRDTRGKRCVKCREENRLRVRRHKESKLADGLCGQCGKDPHIVGKKTCIKCRLSSDALRLTGESSDGARLMDKLLSQNMKCSYTGEKIAIGDNASIDHMIPVSRGGTGDMGNLHWVTWEINRSKNNMTHDEFVSMCHKVVARFPVTSSPAASSPPELRSDSSAE